MLPLVTIMLTATTAVNANVYQLVLFSKQPYEVGTGIYHIL